MLSHFVKFAESSSSRTSSSSRLPSPLSFLLALIPEEHSPLTSHMMVMVIVMVNVNLYSAIATKSLMC